MIEEKIKRLEEIASKIEKGVPFDESLKLYEEAAKLAKICLEELKLAKGKIEFIKKEFDKKEEENG